VYGSPADRWGAGVISIGYRQDAGRPTERATAPSDGDQWHAEATGRHMRAVVLTDSASLPASGPVRSSAPIRPL
jgi:hypothetical protein